MKRCAIFLILLGGITGAVCAQQTITRFAVVDMTRVTAIFVESLPDAKAFIAKRDKVQEDLKKMEEELLELRNKLVELETQKLELVEDEETKASQIKAIENQIKNAENQYNAKRQSASNYYTNSNQELEREMEKLIKDTNFTSRLNTILRRVAEIEGYSMILNKNDAAGILWHSPSIDITQRVIQYMATGR